MGMLEGMIIGGIAGGVGAAIVLATQARNRKKLARVIRDSGDPATARAALDRLYGPRKKLGVYDIIPLTTRFSVLGAIGDLASIRDESEAFPKNARLTCRAQVLGMGLLVRRLLGDPAPDLLPRLEALSAEVERDGGAVLTLVKRMLRAMVAAARAVDGVPMEGDERKIMMGQQKGQPHVKIVWLIAEMYDRLARRETAGIAQMNVQIEAEWPRSAYARKAEELLARAA